MNSQTPKFDAILDKILENLVPHKHVCKWKGEHVHCEGEFEVTSEDIEFLKMLRVPAPNYCPTCRRMKRLIHMNFSRLFKRSCNVPGHKELIISIFPEECPFPVYDYEYYISDDFDAISFGKKYFEKESPIKMLLEMRKKFPMPSFLNRDPSSINSEYSNGGRDVKNGYYVMSCYHVEDVWYSVMINKSRIIMDSRTINNSEIVYNSLYSDHLYKCSFVYFSKDCIDSMFLFDCRNCDNCFGCVNLRGGKYRVFNKQLSKKEYEDFIKSIMPLSRQILTEFKERFWKLVKSMPVHASRNVAVENVSGVLVNNSRNLYDVIDCNNSEHIRHADGCLSHKDSMDVLYSGGNSSLLYSVTNIGSQSSNVKFSISSKFSADSEFIFNCTNVHHCFMCFGLRNKEYCVFNTHYSKEDYYKIVDQMKEKMIIKGEYEDGLGMEFSAQAYNFSMAQISYPLSDEQIIKFGGYVAKEPETNAGDIKILTSKEIPQTIGEVTDDILNYAIKCEVTNRPFRIISSELQFLRMTGLPLPTTHPLVRMHELVVMTPIGKKFSAICANCSDDISSIFNPKDEYILFCEKCFQKEVY